MESQAKTPSPPPPLDLSATIRGLKPGDSYLFTTESPSSVRSLATRIGKKERRSFKSRMEAGGVRLWRKPDQPAQADGE